MTSSPFDNAESLLRERHWLRGFARALVQDDSQADDLVQDTLLVALRRQPERRGGLRPWLARVTRNLAGKRARRDALRTAREREIASAEPLPSAADVVERLSAEQELVRALLALDEAYRYVVVLRYWEDLPPRAIAAKLGVPVETVRTRLKRALAQLRGALDRAHGGDRRAWALPLLGAPIATTATLVGIGALMNAKKTAIAAVIVVTAMAGSAPLWWPAPPPAPATERAMPMVGSTAGHTAVVHDVPTAPTVVARREVAEAPATATVFELTGRCVDERGLPLRGCEVALNGFPGDSQPLARYELHHGKVEWSNPPTQTTGADGRFSFTFTPPPPYRFVVGLRAPHRVWMRAELGALLAHGHKDLGDITLAAGCSVHGVVVDAGGLPQADAEVALQADSEVALQAQSSGVNERRTPETATAVPYYSMRTDASGAFAFSPPLRPGRWTVEVRGWQLLSPSQLEIADQPEQRLEIVVRPLPDVPTITGVVVDEHGAPVRYAMVQSRTNGRVGGTASQHDGSFCLRHDPDLSSGAPILEATAEGFDSGRSDAAVAWGTRDVRLVVRRGAPLEIRVHDRDTGEPIEDFGVRLEWSTRPNSRTGAFVLAHIGHHPGGSLRIDSVSRVPHLLIVEPRGERWLPSGVVAVDVSDRTPPIDVRLSAPRTRTLAVVTADATPVPGVPVELLAPVEGEPIDQQTRALDLVGLGGCNGRRAVLLQRGTTDARGEFELRGPAGTALAVRLPGPGHVPCVEQPITLEDGAPPLTVRVAIGATVRGTIGPPAVVAQMWPSEDLLARAGDKRYLPGVFLRPPGATSREDFPPRPQDERFPIDAEGRFAVAGVPPGTWDLFVMWSEAMSYGGVTTRPTLALALGPLRDGEVREVDVDLQHLLKAHLSGIVRYNGAPPTEGSWVGWQGDTTAWAAMDDNQRLPADGRFACDVDAGTYRLWLSPRERRLLPSAVVVTVAPGDRRDDLVVDVTAGALRVRVLGSDGKPRAGVGLSLATADDAWRPSIGATDNDGTLTYEPVPVGRLRVRALPKHLLDPAAQQALYAANPDDRSVLDRAMIDLGTIDVRPGAEPTTIEVRLPASAGYD